MGRRRRSPPKNPRQGPGHNQSNRRTRESRQRSRMLDAGVEHKFRYYAEESFKESGMEPESWRPILQTLWIRGSRGGIDEAADYVRATVAEGGLTKAMGDRLLRLVEQYSTVR